MHYERGFAFRVTADEKGDCIAVRVLGLADVTLVVRQLVFPLDALGRYAAPLGAGRVLDADL